MVPRPGDPQALNRYAYSLNNPVKYLDPTGHCPQPPANIGSGNIICIAGFIPTEISEAFFRQYQGDDRGFTPFGNTDESSRVWAWIDVTTGKIIDPVSGKPSDKAIFHATVTADGKERWDPLPDNQFTSEKDKDGNIVVKYAFRCSDPSANCMAGPFGKITFKPNQFGSFDTAGDVTSFPNLEAYHWRDGQLQASPFFIRAYSKEEEQSGVGLFLTGATMARAYFDPSARLHWEHIMQQPNDALNVAYPPKPPF